MMLFNRQSDDALISAYIDGQLDERTRRVFEARLAAEPALQRRVETTRQLVQAASALPQVSAPRNFTLPRNMTAPAKQPRAAVSASWGRLGAALAAALFVLAIGLDVSGVMAPRLALPLAAPRAAKSPPATNPTADATAANAAASERVAPEVAQAPTAEAGNSQPPAPEPTPHATPEIKLQVASGITATEPMAIGAGETEPAPPVTAPEVAPLQPLSKTTVLTQTYAATQTQDVAGAVAQPTEASTSTPTLAPAANAEDTGVADAQPPISPVAPNEPAPAFTWLRLVAVLAFMAAAGFAVIGWRR